MFLFLNPYFIFAQYPNIPCNLLNGIGDFQNLNTANYSPQGCFGPECNFTFDGINTPDLFEGPLTYSSANDIAAVVCTVTEGPGIIIPPVTIASLPSNKYFRLSGGNTPDAVFNEGITLKLNKKTNICNYQLGYSYFVGCPKLLTFALSKSPPCATIPVNFNSYNLCANGNNFVVGQFFTAFTGGGSWVMGGITLPIIDEYEYLTIYPSVVNGTVNKPGGSRLVATDLFLDNVFLIEQCAPNLTYTTNIKEKCIGGKIIVEYTVKNTASSAQNVSFTPNSVSPSFITLTNTIRLWKKIG